MGPAGQLVNAALSSLSPSLYVFPSPQTLPNAHALIVWAKTIGVDYDTYHTEFLAKVARGQAAAAKFEASDFTHVVAAGKAFPLCDDAQLLTDRGAIADMLKRDREALQNYGRPYDEGGRARGTYYAHARDLDDVSLWPGVKVRSESE